MKRFVIGDIHGAHRALLQCFERSGFDRETDLLVCLGDICDGWPDVYRVFEELLLIKNLILLLGNHDDWMYNWFLTGKAPEIWLMQGGENSVSAYGAGIPSAHVEMLKTARLYYLLDNYLFVHGGFLTHIPLADQGKNVFLWDRSLVRTALLKHRRGKTKKITDYDRIFVGHTPTINFGSDKPIEACELCLMDTGAGWPGGILTIMNIDTGETFCSDVVSDLYSGVGGR